MSDFFTRKIEQSIRERKATHTAFQKNSNAYAPFLELEQATFADGELSRKHKELMALAISIVTKCEPCMEWHAQQALQQGASEAEFFETVDVAIEMGGGPAAAYARYALQAIKYHRENNN